MKKIAILGSTGKIGSQTLEIARLYPQKIKVVGLAAGHRSKKFIKQIKEFKPKIYASADKDGEKGVVKVVACAEADMVIIAVVGLAGLKPAIAAIKAKKDIGLATKEVLVIAGDLVTSEVKKSQVNLIPLDSEHSAIFQCLRCGDVKEVKKVILTMGKGKIAKMTKNELKKVTIKEILDRPKWKMGLKIAVDSATCINKAFEIIEAGILFNLKPEQIKVTVHPEYLCHSLVEFNDGSTFLEIGTADMRRYIQHALFYPKREVSRYKTEINLYNKKLSFEKPPLEKFPCLKFGWRVLKEKGIMPAVLHGADKTAVDAFIDNKIAFTDIPRVIVKTLDKVKQVKNPNLAELLKAETEGRKIALNLINKGDI